MLFSGRRNLTARKAKVMWLMCWEGGVRVVEVVLDEGHALESSCCNIRHGGGWVGSAPFPSPQFAVI